MPGLVPGIHEFPETQKDVDGRDKPGHDGSWYGFKLLGDFADDAAGDLGELDHVVA